MASLRRTLDGTGPYSGFAVGCWLLGLVWFIAILMSTNGVDWWLNVQTARGHELDGLVYYSVDGSRYTVDDPQAFAGSGSRWRAVYYLASQPADGVLHNTATEALDWGGTAGPGAIGLALFGIGFVRRKQRSLRARTADPSGSFGHGIPDQTIKEILARDRKPSS